MTEFSPRPDGLDDQEFEAYESQRLDELDGWLVVEGDNSSIEVHAAMVDAWSGDAINEIARHFPFCIKTLSKAMEELDNPQEILFRLLEELSERFLIPRSSFAISTVEVLPIVANQCFQVTIEVEAGGLICQMKGMLRSVEEGVIDFRRSSVIPMRLIQRSANTAMDEMPSASSKYANTVHYVLRDTNSITWH